MPAPCHLLPKPLRLLPPTQPRLKDFISQFMQGTANEFGSTITTTHDLSCFFVAGTAVNPDEMETLPLHCAGPLPEVRAPECLDAVVTGLAILTPVFHVDPTMQHKKKFKTLVAAKAAQVSDDPEGSQQTIRQTFHYLLVVSLHIKLNIFNINRIPADVPCVTLHLTAGLGLEEYVPDEPADDGDEDASAEGSCSLSPSKPFILR